MGRDQEMGLSCLSLKAFLLYSHERVAHFHINPKVLLISDKTCYTELCYGRGKNLGIFSSYSTHNSISSKAVPHELPLRKLVRFLPSINLSFSQQSVPRVDGEDSASEAIQFTFQLMHSFIKIYMYESALCMRA